MPWKMTEGGALEADTNGNPIFVLDGGEEKSVDYAAMSTALSKANREAAERKEKLREMEGRAKLFEGIEDVPAFIADAKKNADTVAALSEKEKTAEEATRARVHAAVSPLEKEIAQLKADKEDAISRYHRSLIDAQFGTSKYVNEELVNPAMVKELFSKHFSVDDEGRIIAKDANNTMIYDEDGPAGFDSSLRKLIVASPYKEFVLKGSRANGSGAHSGNRTTPRQNVLSRADFEKMPLAERSEFFRKGGIIQH